MGPLTGGAAGWICSIPLRKLGSGSTFYYSAFFSAFSDLKMEGQKQRHPSGGVSVSTEMVLGLEGVELGADGKVRKYFIWVERGCLL